jgi:hypothetical protein
MNYYKKSIIMVLILTYSVAATSQLGHSAMGQSGANATGTLCDSNQSSSLISGVQEQAQGDFSVECASNNSIILSFPDANSESGLSAADYIMSRSNYTIDDVILSEVGSETYIRVIMSSK